jgi:hypothetical protein
MKQGIFQQQNSFPLLRAIKQPATAAGEGKFERLVTTAWNFASTALWNNTEFSIQEIQRSKELIATWLGEENSEKNFIAFCQRVLLARQYVTSQPGRYIPLPSVWLDTDNKLGFAGTGSWYERINNIREAVPSYKTGIKALAQALLEMSTQPSASHYHYWKSYFIDHHTPGLLSLFQATAIQQMYQ